MHIRSVKNLIRLSACESSLVTYKSFCRFCHVLAYLLKSIPLPFDVCKILLDEWQTVDPDQMLHSAASDLGLHCLFRPVCPNTFITVVSIYDTQIWL